MIKDILNNAEDKMKKTISVLTSDLSTMKAGRANPTMLDRIYVKTEIVFFILSSALLSISLIIIYLLII